jgi:hypothetical protein
MAPHSLLLPFGGCCSLSGAVYFSHFVFLAHSLFRTLKLGRVGPSFSFSLSLVQPTHQLYVESLSSTVGLASEMYSFWGHL